MPICAIRAFCELNKILERRKKRRETPYAGCVTQGLQPALHALHPFIFLMLKKKLRSSIPNLPTKTKIPLGSNSPFRTPNSAFPIPHSQLQIPHSPFPNILSYICHPFKHHCPVKRILLFLFVAFSLVNCNKDDEEVNQSEIDDQIIQQYIADNELDAENIGNGLYFVNEQTGLGAHPTSTSTVRVVYRGYFTNGQVFDESSTDGVVFGLNQVITGWTLGIPYFRVGGIGKLLIPSALAYGPNPRAGIPANSVLIFDIYLDSIL